jgi:hypothetical protein
VPVDVEDSDGRYVLYVKAFEDGSEEDKCAEITRNIEIKRNKDFDKEANLL